ncbi:MAG: MbtH family protein [Candidatus Promineifilaceae bacterium]
MTETENDDTIYAVVVNHEEQYSIWPIDRDLPVGWQRVDVSGTKSECLDYIEEVWTDIRPLSLRQRLSRHSTTSRSSDQASGEE